MGQKALIKQQVDRVSRSKHSGASQSQNGSKERKRSKNLADSHSKDSRRSGTRFSNSSTRGRQRVNTTESSHEKQRKQGSKQLRSGAKAGVTGGKSSSLVGILSLDVMAGPTPDEFDMAGKGLIVDAVLTAKKDHVKKKVVKDSCDIEVEDAMEGMIGGNFNTFGEQAPNALVIKPKNSVEDDVDYQNRGTLIQRIENQIERELNQSKGTSLSNHPMFEVTNQTNQTN